MDLGIGRTFFPVYEFELERELRDCASLLDLGCGGSSPIRPFSKGLFCVGIDAHEPSLEASKRSGIHDEYYRMDALDAGERFGPASFDCVLASDLIEHLTKEQGLGLMQVMETIARKKVIILTPNGFLEQGEHDDNPLQLHRSGWTVDEMRAKGYKVKGINGWKPLRKEQSEIRFEPRWLWEFVSGLTQQYVRDHPKHAYQILCVKTVGRP